MGIRGLHGPEYHESQLREIPISQNDAVRILSGKQTCVVHPTKFSTYPGYLTLLERNTHARIHVRTNVRYDLFEEYKNMRTPGVKYFRDTDSLDLCAAGINPWKFLFITPLMRLSLLMRLRQSYPDLTMSSNVNIIHFKLPEFKE